MFVFYRILVGGTAFFYNPHHIFVCYVFAKFYDAFGDFKLFDAGSKEGTGTDFFYAFFECNF